MAGLIRNMSAIGALEASGGGGGGGEAAGIKAYTGQVVVNESGRFVSLPITFGQLVTEAHSNAILIYYDDQMTETFEGMGCVLLMTGIDTSTNPVTYMFRDQITEYTVTIDADVLNENAYVQIGE